MILKSVVREVVAEAMEECELENVDFADILVERLGSVTEVYDDEASTDDPDFLGDD